MPLRSMKLHLDQEADAPNLNLSTLEFTPG